ncbi:MAG: type II toxin-antitoxin system RelE/ParE family toxin [Caulobacterales bacterium]
MTLYRFSSLARADFAEITRFIARDSPAAARRVGDAIRASCAQLGERPSMGHTREDLTHLPLRFWNVAGRYLIAYRGDAAPIEIVRVFGPGRDVANLLRSS